LKAEQQHFSGWQGKDAKGSPSDIPFQRRHPSFCSSMVEVMLQQMMMMMMMMMMSLEW